MKSRAISFLVVLLGFCGVAADGGEAYSKEFPQGVMTAHQDSIVQIVSTISLKQEFIEAPPGLPAGSLGEAQRAMATGHGTVIDERGLIFVPLAVINSGLLASEIQGTTPLGRVRIRTVSTVEQVKMVKDGQEFEAEIAFSDPAHGVAILQLKEIPAEPLTAIRISESDPKLDPFSQLLILQRLSTDLMRTPSLHTMRYIQKLPGPKGLLDVKGNGNLLGALAFNGAGELVGFGTIPVDEASISRPTQALLCVTEIAAFKNKVVGARLE